MNGDLGVPAQLPVDPVGELEPEFVLLLVSVVVIQKQRSIVSTPVVPIYFY